MESCERERMKPMERTMNIDESESSDARISRLGRMVEALTKNLKQQQQGHKESANYDMITLTQKYNKIKPPEFQRERAKQKKKKVEMTSNLITSANEKSRAITVNKESRGSNMNNGIPICKECGKQHWGICRRLSGACFRCGQRGHLVKSCPRTHPNNTRPNASTTGSVPTP
ncbi:uncharacterized protein LOC114314186 [Camellia sinensis]|uniref:uncharacterized protein LOC114314186 n=1 Tax=Camellia sinensis TaxID=4442 RepID=UPI001035FA71|nr:uncharacterized protein LOC114314186 [Camellia sinensis]